MSKSEETRKLMNNTENLLVEGFENAKNVISIGGQSLREDSKYDRIAADEYRKYQVPNSDQYKGGVDEWELKGKWTIINVQILVTKEGKEDVAAKIDSVETPMIIARLDNTDVTDDVLDKLTDISECSTSFRS